LSQLSFPFLPFLPFFLSHTLICQSYRLEFSQKRNWLLRIFTSIGACFSYF
jgi:hypothetical protein